MSCHPSASLTLPVSTLKPSGLSDRCHRHPCTALRSEPTPTRLIRKSTFKALKKSALITASTALALTGLLAGAGSAQAASSDPGGATNIRGTDPGDTDLMIERLCERKGTLTGVYL